MPDQFPEAIALASVDPSKNRYRLYWLRVQPTLWGELSLVRRWARRGSQGRTQATTYAGADSARAAFYRLLRLRLRHGYQPQAGILKPLQPR
jgi:predicted DNA-binding WGR domain protein